MPKARLVFDGDNIYTEKDARIFKLTDWLENGIDDIPDVVDALNSTSTTDALSANMGRVLYSEIRNWSSVTHFLSTWDSTTGLPATDPIRNPYPYQAGDFYIVSEVASGGGTNYKPDGATYTAGTASTTVETEQVEVNDWYLFDGNSWIRQPNGGRSIAIDSALSTTSTNAVENRVVTNVLSLKQDTINDLSTIRSGAALGATSLQSGDNITELTNNAGYQTAGNVASAIATSLTGYQELLTAGDGISIDNNNEISNTQPGPIVSSSAPSNPSQGDLWYDTTNDILKSYDGTNWNGSGGGGGSVAWGQITGALSNQTDLNTALSNKANDNAVVKLTGAQTISGQKTFSSAIVVPNKTTDAGNSGTAVATEAQVYKKQDTLIPGTNIQIVGSTISAIDTTYTAGTGIDITNNVISATGSAGSVAWGQITGTLSDQTDLQNALNASTYEAGVGIDITEGGVVLPEGYTNLEYIQSNGSAYIDTGIAINTLTNPEIVTTFKMLSLGDIDWFGTNTNSQNTIIWNVNSSSAAAYIRRGTTSYRAATPVGTHSLSELVFSAMHTLDVGGVEPTGTVPILVDGVHVADIGAASNASFTSTETILIGKVRGYNGSCQFKNFAIYSNGVLVFNGVACKNSSDEVGLYDTVSETFFGSDGSDFSAGAEIGAYSTISNTGVTSFNGNTGAVTYTAPVTSVNGNTGAVTVNEPIVSATAPTNPTEGMVWYDTTNDVLKTYDGSAWNETGGGNVKAFYLSSYQDLTTAQAAYDWYVAGKNPIVMMGNTAYFVHSYSLNRLYFGSVNTYAAHLGSYSQGVMSGLFFGISGTTVTGMVSQLQTTSPYVLATGRNYATPYNPEYPGSPATKKYVDDGDTYIGTTAPSTPFEGQLWYDTTNDILKIYDGTNWTGLGTGSGDVVGPSSATDGHLVIFDGTTGKLIKDGGAIPTGVPAAGTDGQVLTVVSGSPAWANATGDIKYSDFEIVEATTGATLTISNLTTSFSPSVDFTVSAGTVKEGMQYVLRIESGATAYTMTLGTGITNPFGETLTLTANKITTVVFFATSSSTLELFTIRTAS